MDKKFCHLHLHSEYSLLDSSAKIKKIISKAKELGMDSIAITDHGVMYGCVAFYKEAKAQGIKPILGCEVYVAAKSMDIKVNDKANSTHHLVLLVKNEIGYQNLMKIVSEASIRGFYYKPRVDHDFLKNHSEGLIALSACLGGEIQGFELKDNYEKAKEVALMYRDIFKDGFYLEIQDHNMEEQKKVIEANIKLSKETGIPLVATNDTHYIEQKGSESHDVLMCIQTGKTVDDPNRRRYPSDKFYLKSPEEMWNMFGFVPEALENTVKIAAECNFDYEFHVSKLPKFPVPEGRTPYDYLQEVCYKGLIERYKVFENWIESTKGRLNVDEFVDNFKDNKEACGYIERLEYELSVINQMGYVDYFLIVWDFIKYAIDNGIPTGPGRGCFVPGTKVLLSSGEIKNIEEFLGGESVITALGNTAIVESLLTYEVKEEIICIESVNEVLKLTKDHKVLASQEKPYKVEWVEAEKLKKDDFIVYPRTKENIKDIQYDLLDYCSEDINVKFNENHIWYEGDCNKINRFITLDDNLCKVIGEYITNGYIISNDSVVFKLNLTEISELIKSIFNLQGNKCGSNIQFNSKILVKFFSNKFNIENSNRIIPSEIIEFASNNQLRIVIGYMLRNNDRMCKSNGMEIRYTTESLSLTRQLRSILSRVGYWAKIEENSFNEYEVCIEGPQLSKWNNEFFYYKIPIIESVDYRNNDLVIDENYIYIKIDNIYKELYEGKVYDISVPGDTSYVANSIAVHNSAAGSIVAYTLGITKIDPIKYSLLFERFLNPERVSMPDIDSDFCYERRQEVIDYVVEKYGENNVSQIITFGTMAARACIRDVGRAMNYSYAEVDRIAKMIPTMLGITIEKALDLNPELKQVYESDERVKRLIDVSKDLEGLPRHSSTHAAGVVIASKELVEYVPLQKNDEMIVTQFDMTTLEELGLLKMDFLGLRTLTVMSDAVRMIKENRGIEIDLDKINFDDKDVYKMIGEGKTAGVFQLESPGMISFMKELKPDNLEDIIAGISLYRPGPMAEIPKYIECKKNPDKVQYITPELEDILNVTYGVMVYQEQVMEIVRKLAGYSMGRSDLVRRAMSKKKHKVMEEERRNFIYGVVDENGNIEVPGCLRNGIGEEEANKIYDMMMDFASYAFNKSHAAAYAVVGYQTAYLMKYYPVEMTAAMLNSFITTNEKVAHYIKFAEASGIRVLPPNINESYAKFTVKGDDIIFGLAAIRNVGKNVIDSVTRSREEKGVFESLQDFINKIDLSSINKRAVESLIKAGALDCFGVFRSKQLAVFEKVMDSVANEKKRNIDGQISLFGIAEDEMDVPEIQYPNIKEFAKNNLLAMEKEMTGIYITGHPLEEYKESLKMQTSVTIEHIYKSHEYMVETMNEEILSEEDHSDEMNQYIHDDEKVIIGGIISVVNQKITRNNTMMAFVTLEDLTDSIEIIVFPKTLDKVRNLLNQDGMIVVRGRASIKEDEAPKIICETIEPLERVNSSKVYLRTETKETGRDLIRKLRTMPIEYRGESALYIYIAKENQNYRMAREMWINLETEVDIYLKSIVGEENFKIIEK